MNDITLRVAMKSVIVHDGKILILREASTYDDGTQTGRWHMAGGRVNPGEHFEDALRREIREETGLEVDVLYPLYVGEWRPVIKGVQNQIIATFNVCRAADGEVVLSSEHDAYEWISPEEYVRYDLMYPEGDVIQRYIDWHTEGLPK